MGAARCHNAPVTTRRRRGLLYYTVKWLVIPAGLFLLGFYVVGPRLGSTGAEMLAKLAQRHALDAESAGYAPDAGEPKFDGPPDVDVTDSAR